MTTLKSNFRVSSKIEAFYTGGQVAISQDGKFMFCPFGHDVNVLDTQTGRVVHTLKQEDGGEVTCLIVSPDDKMLIVAYSKLLLKQWDWTEETCTRTWKAIHIAPVVSMAFDSTSTLLATGSSDSTIKVWDVIKQYCTHNLKGSQVVVNLLEFHPDPSKLFIFSSSSDNMIRVWDLNAGKCMAQLEKHVSTVTSMSFNKDASLLFSAGRDSVVTIWKLEDFSEERTLPVFEPLEAVMVLPNDRAFPELNIPSPGNYFITCGGQGALKVWDVATGRHIFTQSADLLQSSRSNTYKEGETRVSQGSLCTALDSIVIVTYDHNIVFFSINDLKITKQMVGNNDEILDVRFLGPEESHLAVVSNSDQIKVFELATLNCQILTGHTDIIVAIDVFKKGTMLVSSSKDNTVRLWLMDSEDKTIQCIGVGKGHTHSVLSVVCARLSRKFFVSGGEDLTFKVWKLSSENRKGLENGQISTLNVSYTEKAHDKSINSLAISPNDKLLATGSQDKTAKLWHLEQEAFLGSFRGHKRGIWCVQFSPTDQALATSSADGSIKIWSITDFSCVKTFEGHDASVLKVTFLSRGMQILSSGSDGLLKLWTIKNNECVKTFDEHDDKVWAITPTKNESHVVTAGADSTIMMWQDVTQIEHEEVREKEEERILREQQLSNLLQEKKYLRALGLAITLNQPFKALTIIKSILDQPEGDDILNKTIQELNEEQIVLLMGYVQIWNTNAKHCHYAQLILSIILKDCPLEDKASSNMKEMIEGLLPYTERHFHRMGRLMQQATFLEYTWQIMRRASGAPPSSENITDLAAEVGLPTVSPSATAGFVGSSKGAERQGETSDEEDGEEEEDDELEEENMEADEDDSLSDGESGLESETEIKMSEGKKEKGTSVGREVVETVDKEADKSKRTQLSKKLQKDQVEEKEDQEIGSEDEDKQEDHESDEMDTLKEKNITRGKAQSEKLKKTPARRLSGRHMAKLIRKRSRSLENNRRTKSAKVQAR